MISKQTQTLLSAAALSLGASLANADADIAVQAAGTGGAEATANVDLRVVVPEILIFGVGAVGDTIAQVQWTIDNAAGVGTGDNQTYSGTPGPFVSPAPFDSAATAAVTNGGTGSSATNNQASLPVFLFSNNGQDVTINTTVAGGAAGAGTADALDNQTVAGTSIPIAQFLGGDGGVITQPALNSAGSATASPTAGIVNLSDTWTYEYTPASIPTAGTYAARVTYVVSTP